MKILGDLEWFQDKNIFNHEQQSARKKNEMKTSETQQSTNHWKKKKGITSTSKHVFQSENIPSVQESKQNQSTKQKKYLNQHQQSLLPNSNIAMFSTPFRMKNNNKHTEQTPIFIKSQNRNHCTQIMMDVSKLFSPYSSVKSQQMKELEKKALEGKLEYFDRWENKNQQNKKKSVSYRVHFPPKQFNFTNNDNLQKQIKTNTHQIIPSQYDQRRRQQNKTQMEKKTPLLNRQKSSQSFIIKKKFNNNVVQSLKPEQQKFSNRFTYIMQKFKKDHFAEEVNSRDFIDIPYQDVAKSPQSSIYYDKNKKEVTNQNKQSKQKEHHHLKAGRSLKVRVNKLIKQQQNLFKKGLSGEKQLIIFKTEHQEPKIQEFLRYHTNQQIDMAALQKSVKMAKSPYNVEGNDLEKDENSIVINHANLKGQTTQSSEEVLNSSPNCDSQRKIENNSNLLIVKNKRQVENGSNLKNRKSKITSIRAIKNYIKRHDKEERSPFPPQQKELKQIGSVKKREKQTSCLTHKIKWGNVSKKKLNSDKGINSTSNQFFNECSVEGKMKPKVKRFQIQKQPQIEQKQDEQMITIEAQLKSHETKKRQSNRVQFPSDQYQTSKVTGHSTKKSNINPQKQHTNSQKQTQNIDNMGIRIQRTCSNSLVGFEDPGISLIANDNDSIHMTDTILILPSFQRLPFQALEMIDNNMISPVAMMKKIKQEHIDEKMESLQELYSELRSHKENKSAKTGNQLLRLNSIEEFFQKQ